MVKTLRAERLSHLCKVTYGGRQSKDGQRPGKYLPPSMLPPSVPAYDISKNSSSEILRSLPKPTQQMIAGLQTLSRHDKWGRIGHGLGAKVSRSQPPRSAGRGALLRGSPLSEPMSPLLSGLLNSVSLRTYFSVDIGGDIYKSNCLFDII